MSSERIILPEHTYVPGDDVSGGVEEDGATACVICLETLVAGDVLKTLPCEHGCFHSRCIDAWLQRGAGACPVCRHKL